MLRAKKTWSPALLALSATAMLSACHKAAEATLPDVRPVRTVTVVEQPAGETALLTGHIEAENEVDDAMTTVDVMTTRLAAGDTKVRSATFAYETLAFPMLTGSFVTAAAFVPIGFARSSAGEYTFSIFAAWFGVKEPTASEAVCTH